MRVPIMRTTDGKFIIQLNFDQTPDGFEDVFEDSLFYRRYQESRAHGEYGSPDVTALTGNPTAQIVRERNIEERRTCLTLLHQNQMGPYIQMEVRPFGPYGNQMRDYIALTHTNPAYLTFRTYSEVNEDGKMVVTQINGADFTTN